MDRVGIYGWSYGGYLTLMGLVQFPNIFKVAVAGAPVTSWDLYDTGYTERYMGLPSSNLSAYQRRLFLTFQLPFSLRTSSRTPKQLYHVFSFHSSVLSHIHLFPEEEGRLLIVHGLLDENVHFTHTAQLINALVKAGKPHSLQVRPA